MAVIGAIGLVASSVLFLTEANVQHKKQKQMKDSQARFELEHSPKAQWIRNEISSSSTNIQVQCQADLITTLLKKMNVNAFTYIITLITF